MRVSTIKLRAWHRRLALVLGLFFIVQGLTGAIAQQRFWLLQATDPAGYRVVADGAPMEPGSIAALVTQERPGFQIAHMMYPAAVSPNTAVVVMGGRDTSRHDMSRMVMVDQFTGRIIREQSSMGGWVGLASAIHKWLIFGTPGKIILTLLGVGVIAFSLLGLVIWWRTRGTSRNAKGVVRVHRTAGVAAAAFILSVAFTGVWLNLSTWAEKSSGRSVFASNMVMAHDAAMVPPRIDGNAAYRAALDRIGDQHLIAYGPAGMHARNFWFAFMDPQLFRTDVLVSPQSGQVIGIYPSGLTSGGTGARAWLFPIHSGYVIGPIGGVIYSLIGVSVSLWVLTGFMMWWRQRRRHRKARSVANDVA